tara:strand:+ start:156 stop:1097 length:942 start_codon:yes stop_codon:yes gene_type:complete
MALDLTGLTAYVDENKMELIKKSILQGRTLEYVTIQPDIKSSATINIIDTDLVIQAGACGWNADGTTTLSQRPLAVDKMKVNEATCVDDLEAYYTQKMMNAGSYNETIPFEQIYSEDKSEKIANEIDNVIWKGDKGAGVGNLAFSDGYFKLIDSLAGSTVNGNTGAVTVATGITAANVVDIVDGMVNSVPEDIINADDLFLFMSYANYRTYAKALRDANLYHYNGQEDQGQEFSQMVPGTNVRVVALKGFSGTARMILSRKANLYFGTDLLNDSEDFDIFYSKDNDEVRFLSKWKQGVQVAFPSFIVDLILVP